MNGPDAVVEPCSPSREGDADVLSQVRDCDERLMSVQVKSGYTRAAGTVCMAQRIPQGLLARCAKPRP